jgi:hypothetical protein
VFGWCQEAPSRSSPFSIIKAPCRSTTPPTSWHARDGCRACPRVPSQRLKREVHLHTPSAPSGAQTAALTPPAAPPPANSCPSKYVPSATHTAKSVTCRRCRPSPHSPGGQPAPRCGPDQAKKVKNEGAGEGESHQTQRAQQISTAPECTHYGGARAQTPEVIAFRCPMHIGGAIQPPRAGRCGSCTHRMLPRPARRRQSRCSVAPRRRSSTAAPATTVPALRIVTCAEGAWAAGVRSSRRGTGCWLPNAPGGRRRQGRRRGPRNGPREGLPPTIWRILADVP